MENPSLKGYSIQWHRDATEYLTSNGPKAFEVLLLVFLICFFCGIVELALFMIYSANLSVLSDSAMFFLNSACFATGMAGVSRNTLDGESRPMPFLDLPLRDIMNSLPIVAVVIATISSVICLPYAIAFPAKNSGSTLLFSLLSSLASCALAGGLKISNFRKRVKDIFFGGR